MKRFLKILSITLGSLCGLVCLLLVGVNLYFRLPARELMATAERHGEVPGLSDGCVQQGLHYIESEGIFIATGYMADKTASRLYLLDPDSGASKYICFQKPNGEPDKNHCGGVSYDNGHVLVSNGGRILVYSYEQIRNAPEGGQICYTSRFSVGTNASFCHVEGDTLYVGEYFDVGYDTDPSHHLTTPSGEQYHALLLAYDLKAIRASGYTEAPTPTRAYAIRNNVQGCTVTPEGKLCLTVSHGATTSLLLVYDNAAPTHTVALEGQTVPLSYLDESALCKQLQALPMAEEPAIKDGRLYLNCESASDKYLFGRLYGGGYLYSFPCP